MVIFGQNLVKLGQNSVKFGQNWMKLDLNSDFRLNLDQIRVREQIKFQKTYLGLGFKF